MLDPRCTSIPISLPVQFVTPNPRTFVPYNHQFSFYIHLFLTLFVFFAFWGFNKMGKRKRRAENNKAPASSDSTQHPPQRHLQSEQRSLERAESSATQPPPSFMDALNSSLKNHTLLLKPSSRHSLGRHYSRRNSTNHSNASPSNWMATPSYDAKLSFKLEKQNVSEIPYRESRGRIFQKMERIRSSSLTHNTVSGDVRKMECRICEKRLRKHPFIIENSISSGDLSVVAVLVCGHAYHADCLEQNTNQEDSQDPNCPLCGSETS